MRKAFVCFHWQHSVRWAKCADLSSLLAQNKKRQEAQAYQCEQEGQRRNQHRRASVAGRHSPPRVHDFAAV